MEQTGIVCSGGHPMFSGKSYQTRDSTHHRS